MASFCYAPGQPYQAATTTTYMNPQQQRPGMGTGAAVGLGVGALAAGGLAGYALGGGFSGGSPPRDEMHGGNYYGSPHMPDPNLAGNVYDPNSPGNVYDPNLPGNVYDPNLAGNVHDPNLTGNMADPNMAAHMDPNLAGHVPDPDIPHEDVWAEGFYPDPNIVVNSDDGNAGVTEESTDVHDVGENADENKPDEIADANDDYLENVDANDTKENVDDNVGDNDYLENDNGGDENAVAIIGDEMAAVNISDDNAVAEIGDECTDEHEEVKEDVGETEVEADDAPAYEDSGAGDGDEGVTVVDSVDFGGDDWMD